MERKKPSTEELLKMIDRRYEVQKFLTLLRDLTLKEETYSRLQRNNGASAFFSQLLGSGFALWRAAFFATAPRENESIMEAAKEFFEHLIGTNWIGFNQEREAQSWMFGHYVNNARYRLYRLCEEQHLYRELPAMDELYRLKQTGVIGIPTYDVWDVALKASNEALGLFKKHLSAPDWESHFPKQ